MGKHALAKTSVRLGEKQREAGTAYVGPMVSHLGWGVVVERTPLMGRANLRTFQGTQLVQRKNLLMDWGP